jgi:penicillin-binding protein 1A
MKKVTGGGLPAKAWHDFMVAAHEGLSLSPLFGTTGVQPVFDEGGMAAAGETAPDGLMGGDPETFPAPPAAIDGTAAVEQVRPAEQAGGPIPAAGVGETTGTTRRTTLFELLTGG